MSIIKEWFERSSGEWISNRRYFYEPSGRNHLIKSEITVEVKPSETNEFAVELNWYSTGDSQSTGTMLCEFDEDKSILHRNIGYMTDDPTFSEVSMIDEDTILFKTEYSGMTFREEIRLIEDNVRLRQTLGWKNNKVFLAGQYYEKRK